jgi:hypothetical protein
MNIPLFDLESLYHNLSEELDVTVRRVFHELSGLTNYCQAI